MLNFLLFGEGLWMSSPRAPRRSRALSARPADDFSTSSSTIPFNRNFIRIAAIHKTNKNSTILYDSDKPKLELRLPPGSPIVKKRTIESKPVYTHQTSNEDINKKRNRSRSEGITENNNQTKKSFTIDQSILTLIFGQEQEKVTHNKMQIKFHHVESKNQIMVTMNFQFNPLPPTKIENKEKIYNKKTQQFKKTFSSDNLLKLKIEKKEQNKNKTKLQAIREIYDLYKQLPPKMREQNIEQRFQPIKLDESRQKKKRANSISNHRISRAHQSLSAENLSYTRFLPKTSTKLNLPVQKNNKYHSIISLVVFFDLFAENVVENLVQSHFNIITYRMRILTQIIFDFLSKTKKPSNTTDDSLLPFSSVANPSFENITNMKRRKIEKPKVKFLENNEIEIDEFILQANNKFNKAIFNFQENICNFMIYPRLQPPAWLHIISYSDARRETICTISPFFFFKIFLFTPFLFFSITIFARGFPPYYFITSQFLIFHPFPHSCIAPAGSSKI